MKLKTYFLVIFCSLILFFGLAPLGGNLGGYGGHHIKYFVASLLYFALTYYFLGKTKTANERIITVFLILLPLLVILIPAHLLSKNSQGAYLSSLGHFIGVFFGVFVHLANKRVKVILAIILLVSTIWVSLKGYSLWLHKVNFGTFLGNVSEDIKPFELKNERGKYLTIKDVKNKIIVLDFWNTRCGVCFRKFPILEEKYIKHKNYSNLNFYAVNIPIKGDTIGEAYRAIRKRDYTFPILVAKDQETAKTFGVSAYPTTLILCNSKIVYRGDIEGIDGKIESLLKEL